MMTIKYLVAVVFIGSCGAANVRPNLPQCECMQKWPYSNDTAMWAKSFGNAPDQWEVNASLAVGCVMVSKDYPYKYKVAKDAFQFCVPDTSKGPCIGLGGFSANAMSFYMACGKQTMNRTATWNDTITANASHPTPALTSLQKTAAMAYSDAISLAVQNPACTCESDWSASKLAETYCGSNKTLAKDSVSEETCFNAPGLFNNAVTDKYKGTLDYGYYRKDQSPKQQHAIVKWCKVQEKCSMAFGGVDGCTGERWMATHKRNVSSLAVIAIPAAQKMSAMQYSGGVYQFARDYARQVLAKTSALQGAAGMVPLGGLWYIPMTFFPESVSNLMGNEDLTPKAQAAAVATRDKYDKIDWLNDHINVCNATCKLAQIKKDEDNKKVMLENKNKSIKTCDADPVCKPKQAGASCATILQRSLDHGKPKGGSASASTTQKYTGTIKITAKGATKTQVETAMTKTLAKKLSVEESAVTTTATKSRRLLESPQNRRLTDDSWSVDFVVNAPASKVVAIDAAVKTLVADTADFAKELKPQLIAAGVSAADADSVKVQSFASVKAAAPGTNSTGNATAKVGTTSSAKPVCIAGVALLVALLSQ